MIKAYKPVGKTPLELLQQLKLDGAAYAGRLDPMAEGLMIFLDTEEEKQNRKIFEKLEKVYEFDYLVGIQTDSYDILGIPRLSLSDMHSSIKTGKQIQKYPPYSYYRVGGKPLFWWARNKKLAEITIPEKEINILNFKVLEEYSMNNTELLGYITQRVSKVKGDFRQQEILLEWNKILKNNADFKCVKARIVCSGGTYIRGLVNDLGAVALNIKRTNIGDYDLSDVISLSNESEDKESSD